MKTRQLMTGWQACRTYSIMPFCKLFQRYPQVFTDALYGTPHVDSLVEGLLRCQDGAGCHLYACSIVVLFMPIESEVQ